MVILIRLKALVEALIKCESGKWSSPGGEAKMFKSKNFSIKWYGPKKRKLIIVEDNEEELLYGKPLELKPVFH